MRGSRCRRWQSCKYELGGCRKSMKGKARSFHGLFETRRLALGGRMTQERNSVQDSYTIMSQDCKNTQREPPPLVATATFQAYQRTASCGIISLYTLRRNYQWTIR